MRRQALNMLRGGVDCTSQVVPPCLANKAQMRPCYKAGVIRRKRCPRDSCQSVRWQVRRLPP